MLEFQKHGDVPIVQDVLHLMLNLTMTYSKIKSNLPNPSVITTVLQTASNSLLEIICKIRKMSRTEQISVKLIIVAALEFLGTAGVAKP